MKTNSPFGLINVQPCFDPRFSVSLALTVLSVCVALEVFELHYTDLDHVPLGSIHDLSWGIFIAWARWAISAGFFKYFYSFKQMNLVLKVDKQAFLSKRDAITVM